MPDDPPAPDLAQLLAEIDAEVARKLASGEIPADLEDELETTFARYSPPAVAGGDLGELVEQVRRAAHVDTAAPLESSRPGVAEAKRVVRKAIAFQLRHVADQVTHLGHRTADGLEALAMRVDDIDRQRGELDAIRATVPVVDGSWIPTAAVLDALAGVEGRVLHLGAADGSLALAASAAGIDAYGVEADARRSGGIDALTRTADPVAHLASVADEVLGAVVISIEENDVLGHHRLLGEAVRATRRGGRVIITTRRRVVWESGVGQTVADLVAGGPLSPETWCHLLTGLGVAEATAIPIDDGRCYVVAGFRR